MLPLLAFAPLIVALLPVIKVVAGIAIPWAFYRLDAWLAADTKDKKDASGREAVIAFELASVAKEKFGGDAIGDFVAAHTHYVNRIPWSPA